MTIEECVLKLFPDASQGHIGADQEPVFFITCPGESLHTPPTKETDTCIRYSSRDYPLSIHCFHNQCWGIRMRMAQELWSMNPENVRTKPKSRSTKERADLDAVDKVALKILRIQEDIFRDYRDESFLEKKLGLGESRERCLALFPPDAIIWYGEVRDSGSFRGGGHFRVAEDWLYRISKGELYHFISVCAFKPGSISRSRESVLTQPFRVIEFDRLSPDPIENQLRSWAMFRRLQEKYNLKLALVVYTGNKSLHFWVYNEERFSSGIFQRLLEKIGADVSAWRSLRPNPVRFPGVIRTDEKVTNQPQCVIGV